MELSNKDCAPTDSNGGEGADTKGGPEDFNCIGSQFELYHHNTEGDLDIS